MGIAYGEHSLTPDNSCRQPRSPTLPSLPLKEHQLSGAKGVGRSPEGNQQQEVLLMNQQVTSKAASAHCLHATRKGVLAREIT